MYAASSDRVVGLSLVTWTVVVMKYLVFGIVAASAGEYMEV